MSVLAFALNDPAFGVLYASLVIVLAAGLALSPRLPLTWMRALQLLAVAGAGFVAGVALHATRTDVSGQAPLSIAREALPAAVTELSRHGPRTGPVDHQISVERFDSSAAQRVGMHADLVMVKGDALIVRGWAWNTLAGTACSSVDVTFDGKLGAAALADLPRPDVAVFYHDERHTATGFSALIPTRALAPGRHAVVVRCIDGPRGLAFPNSTPLTITLTAP